MVHPTGRIINGAFQSTLPRRERRWYCTFPCIRENISIHAPAKGATRVPIGELVPYAHFNPRSREGSDVGMQNT